MTAWTCLGLGVIGVLWFAYPTDNWPRDHVRWIVRATIGFVLPALAGLAILGRWDALWVLPPEFAPISALLPRLDPADIGPAMALGLPFGIAIVWGRIRWLRHRGRPLPISMVVPAPLAARKRAMIWPALVTALVTGWAEEIAFRLFLPLTATLAMGSAWAGFILATAAFVFLHRYQSWFGRIGVLLTAIVLTALYLATGALWFVIALHATIDVIALAVRPWLAGFRR